MAMHPYSLIIIALWLLTSSLATEIGTECTWRTADDKTTIYWINMDKSRHRRKEMEDQFAHTGMHNERFAAITMQNIHIPEDIRRTWMSGQALFQTHFPVPTKSIGQNEDMTVVLSGLYGRRRLNRITELGCTISHLLAIRHAIYNNQTDSKYAVITEDDVFFPFAIDWTAMAESAPSDFGVLQLFNSNEESMRTTFNDYIKSRRRGEHKLWHETFSGQPARFWSTCAYLINREKLKPVIDAIITVQGEALQQYYDLKVIAGHRWLCVPAYSPCCLNPTNYTFSEIPPCILAHKGFQADSFIYAMTKTYVSTIPYITNGVGGNRSTFHQDHVETFHYNAFKRQRLYINDIIEDRVDLPPFIAKSCGKHTKPLEIHEMQLIRKIDECSYTNRSEEELKGVPSVYWINHRSGTYLNETAGRQSLGGHRMAVHLERVGLSHRQVQRYNPMDLVLAERVAGTWQSPQECMYSDLQQGVDRGEEEGYISVRGLCGRDMNTMDQLSLTISHLAAMHEAIYHPIYDNDYPYAIIAEDDVIFPLDIQWNELIKTAPSDFSVLTLMIPNARVASIQWWRQLHNSSYYGTWAGSRQKSEIELPHSGLGQDKLNEIFDDRIAKAYIINRHVLKQLIGAIVVRQGEKEGYQRYAVNVVTQSKEQLSGEHCTPKQCCTNTSTSTPSGCLSSPLGFGIESVLTSLSMLSTYVLMLPLIVTDVPYMAKVLAVLSDTSRQQSSQDIHKFTRQLIQGEYASLKVQRNFMNNMIEGTADLASLPFGVKAACRRLVSLDQKNFIKEKRQVLVDEGLY